MSDGKVSAKLAKENSVTIYSIAIGDPKNAGEHPLYRIFPKKPTQPPLYRLLSPKKLLATI